MLMLKCVWMAAMMMMYVQNHLVISDLVSIFRIRKVWISANLYLGKRFDYLSWLLQLTIALLDCSMASSVSKTKTNNATLTF